MHAMARRRPRTGLVGDVEGIESKNLARALNVLTNGCALVDVDLRAAVRAISFSALASRRA